MVPRLQEEKEKKTARGEFLNNQDFSVQGLALVDLPPSQVALRP